MESMNVLGLRVDRVNMNQAMELAKKGIEEKEPCVIVTPNSEIIMRAREDARLERIIRSAAVVVPDGIGLVLASKIMGLPLQERVTGIDLMQNLLKWASEDKKKIYFLGGKPGIAEKAASKIKEEYPDIDIVGARHGYFKGLHTGAKGHEEELAVVSDIAQKKPDMLFVALGAPNQEYFIDTYKEQLNAGLLMGVGGSLDVLSGELNRAPEFYRNYGLEWLYRLIKEPWRIKRMKVLPVFMLKVIWAQKK